MNRCFHIVQTGDGIHRVPVRIIFVMSSASDTMPDMDQPKGPRPWML